MLRPMSNDTVHRLLEVVQRELEAADARLEIGGRPPDPAHCLWCDLKEGWRLVTVFATPPSDRAAAQQRLEALAETFGDLSPDVALSRFGGQDLRAVAQRRLDDELHALALRTGALRALVLDDRSPILWGTSEPREAREDVETAVTTATAAEAAAQLELALEDWVDGDPAELAAELRARAIEPAVATRLELAIRQLRDASRRQGKSAWRHHVLAMRAVAAVRQSLEAEPTGRAGHRTLVHREDGFGYFARGFASIYLAILVFDSRFSELHAEGGLLQALPRIERMVLALPSTDPPPAGGKVVRLPR